MMKFFIRVVVLGVLLMTGAAARGHYTMPEPVPLDRMIKNLNAYIEEHPDDATGYYSLGRVHSMAFVTGVDVLYASRLRAGEGIQPQNIPRDASHPGAGPKLVSWRQQVPILSQEQKLHHLEQAIQNIERAIDIGFDGEYAARPQAAAHLSLAYALEKGAEHAAQVDVLPADPDDNSLDDAERAELEALVEKLVDAQHTEEAQRTLTDSLMNAAPILFKHREDLRIEVRKFVDEFLSEYWIAVAAKHYVDAFNVAFEGDTEQDVVIGSFKSFVSYEAGQAYLRLLREHPQIGDEATTQVVKEGLKHHRMNPPSTAITPIIFSLDAAHSLSDLLSPATIVDFDLDGTGRQQRWPWVKPDTAILCWDPLGTGEITSGRQLFGSVTWWLFLPDGYRALDALDDDRDGWLRGDEMVGMAIWRDHNSDGVSDPGELVYIEETDIEAIATRAVTTEDGSPANPNGLRLKNSSTLPTYDWIAHSIEDN